MAEVVTLWEMLQIFSDAPFGCTTVVAGDDEICGKRTSGLLYILQDDGSLLATCEAACVEHEQQAMSNDSETLATPTSFLQWLVEQGAVRFDEHGVYDLNGRLLLGDVSEQLAMLLAEFD